MGSLVIVLLQIISVFWQWKKVYQIGKIFNEVIRRTKMYQIFGPPCHCHLNYYCLILM